MPGGAGHGVRAACSQAGSTHTCPVVADAGHRGASTPAGDGGHSCPRKARGALPLLASPLSCPRPAPGGGGPPSPGPSGRPARIRRTAPPERPRLSPLRNEGTRSERHGPSGASVRTHIAAGPPLLALPGLGTSPGSHGSPHCRGLSSRHVGIGRHSHEPAPTRGQPLGGGPTRFASSNPSDSPVWQQPQRAIETQLAGDKRSAQGCRAGVGRPEI